jgi:hypothetical protein
MKAAQKRMKVAEEAVYSTMKRNINAEEKPRRQSRILHMEPKKNEAITPINVKNSHKTIQENDKAVNLLRSQIRSPFKMEVLNKISARSVKKNMEKPRKSPLEMLKEKAKVESIPKIRQMIALARTMALNEGSVKSDE